MPEPTSVTESNPLRQALPRARVPEPCAIVLFGSTGDLAHRKLMPALFQAFRHGKLPEGGRILAVSRQERNDASYRAWLS